MANELPFVILHHSNPGPNRADHWDLMLQQDQILITFEIPIDALSAKAISQSRPPKHGVPHNLQACKQSIAPTISQARSEFEATRLPDHRLHYLTYEGKVSGNRGSVQQIDSGTYQMKAPGSDLEQSLSTNSAIILINGGHFRGQLQLFLKKTDTTTYRCLWIEWQIPS